MVNWAIGLFLTYIVLRLVLKPLVSRLKHEKDEILHRQKHVEDLLDPTTPGGLGDVMVAIKQAETDNMQN
jgi:hypothetical protein